jgi:lysyl-tRNA synthetase class 2
MSSDGAKTEKPVKEGKKKKGSAGEAEAPQEGIEQIREARVNKLKLMRDAGINPFEYTYAVTHKTDELQKLCKDLKDGEENADLEVSIAGRIMVRRVFGKLAFFTLQDETGTIQLYIEKGRLGEGFDRIKEWTDNSDVIGVKGTMKRTEKGELSVYVKEWSMLTKSLMPLPDKFHGLTGKS